MNISGQRCKEGDLSGVFLPVENCLPKVSNTPSLGNVEAEQCRKLFRGLPDEPFVYFVHSYHAEIGEATICTSEYIEPLTAGLCSGNFFGLQFHPEKSGAVGQQILQNFVNL